MIYLRRLSCLKITWKSGWYFFYRICIPQIFISWFRIIFWLWRTHKQKELEDELQSMMRKSADCSKSSSKLTSDLHQKENVVNAQAEEASQWRDKVRRAESEIEKLKASFSDKLDEVSKLKAQIETKKNEISAKDAQIHEAQENLSKVTRIWLQNNTSCIHLLKYYRWKSNWMPKVVQAVKTHRQRVSIYMFKFKSIRLKLS